MLTPTEKQCFVILLQTLHFFCPYIFRLYSFLYLVSICQYITKLPDLCLYTCGRQSGRASKITRRTPIGTVICSSSRLWATLVLRSTRPTLSWAATAIWCRPRARLFSLAGDKLSRFSMAAGKRPVGKKNTHKVTLWHREKMGRLPSGGEAQKEVNCPQKKLTKSDFYFIRNIWKQYTQWKGYHVNNIHMRTLCT